ncbi:hypothetical protein H2202_009840 [Exophiala xenobiotica]|nr:hypothetical protein H2202_009840 [Exophiala xenobiotica]
MALQGQNGSATKEDVEKDVELQQRVPTAPMRDPGQDLVEFEGPDDPQNPKNWSKARKWKITAAMGGMTFVVTFASSVFGFVFGPIFFGPASEVFGRRIPLFSGYLCFAIFQIPVAVAQNVETIMLGRFFGGFAASSPLAVIGGALADIWNPIDRAYGVCIFAAAAFSGPVAGPIIGGFVTQSYLGWRWTAWITMIMAALFGCIGYLVIPETSAAKILQTKAKKLRYETKNWALHAKADESPVNAKTLIFVYLVRPFIMIFQEPILALVTAYMSFIYGILYLFFESLKFPISFQEERGWNEGVGSLPFASFIVGIAMGTGLIAYSTRTNFTKAFEKHGRPIPEERLPPMIVGAAVLPVGLFWFAWTSDPHITWVPQVLSVALLGMGCLVTFWQGMNYIIDCYGFYSNSAIAVNTFVRSIAAAGFPLFAPAMYHHLGTAWSTSLLAFLCVAFFPTPILFYKYGAKIRQKSRFKPTG